MCGIVGAISRRNVVPILLEGLKRLEYRGYDSAGIAVVNGTLTRLRSTGRVAELARRADESRARRPARHRAHALGDPRRALRAQRASARLGHASRSCTTASSRTTRRCAGACRREGYVFTSDTDTEVIAHLVHSKMAKGASLLDAVRASVARARRRLRDRGRRREGPAAPGRRAHGRAAAARPGRRREFRRVRRLRAGAGDAARDLPRGRRLRRGRARAACA